MATFHIRENKPLFLAISLLPEGVNPGLPAFTPDHKTLVVPNQDTDSVSIVSLERLSVTHVTYLEKSSCPWQAKVCPDGTYAFVTNSRFNGTVENSSHDNSTVAVLDARTWELKEYVEVGAGPNGVTVDENSARAYIANMRSNTVSVIDIKKLKTIDTVEVGQAPAFAKLTKDMRMLLVTNYEDSSLSIIDVKEMRVKKTIPIGIPGLREPHPEWGAGDTVGVAATSAGFAYLTNYRSHELVAINLSSLEVVARVKTIDYPFGIEVEPRLDMALVSSMKSGKFAVHRLSNFEMIGNYSVDGTSLPRGELCEINHWMTDPINHRITAILPNGYEGISRDWSKNIVCKPF